MLYEEIIEPFIVWFPKPPRIASGRGLLGKERGDGEEMVWVWYKTTMKIQKRKRKTNYNEVLHGRRHKSV